jgi:hypothetical protein
MGCVKNDIPYPRIQANFLSFSVKGQERNAVIDTINRTVSVYLPEDIDITNVEVESYSVTNRATVVGANLDEPLNLTSTLYLNLELYQDWQWSISAVQTIERYFTVSGQVGSSVIDVPGRRIIANISKTASLSDVMVESIKLGPEGSTMSPDITGQHINFTHPVSIDVTAYGRTATWTIYVQRSDVSISTVRADAWTNVAWLYGQAEAGKDNGFEYRLKGAAEWTRVAEGDLTINGGEFSARIIHLSPLTTYEARAYSDDAYGETLEFTTGSTAQLPNASFDNWWQNDKVWNPWAEGDDSFWDTGNKGATTLGSSNTVPTDDTATGKGMAAKLETRFVGVGALGKLAAGNIFSGEYYRTDGTNGILHFGRPWTDRPTKLRGYLKYNTAPINYTSSGFEYMAGQPDTCIVWVALIDQADQFEIRTNPKNRQLFDPDGSYVVAYGKVEFGRDVPNYTKFEIELNYKSTQRVPKYILVTASASKYGDYFTGGAGAVLYLDDFELEYDY